MPEWMNIAEMAPEQPEKRIHLERYEYAGSALAGRRIMDCACGMGYGTDILGALAHGIDIDPEAVSLARQSYPNRQFSVGNYLTIPFDGYDAVVSFETLEHLDDPEAVLGRMPETITDLVASVPIRPTVGWNSWHRSDFTKDSFREMIRRHFPEIVFEKGQMWVDGEDLYLFVHGRRG